MNYKFSGSPSPKTNSTPLNVFGSFLNAVGSVSSSSNVLGNIGNVMNFVKYLLPKR